MTIHNLISVYIIAAYIALDAVGMAAATFRGTSRGYWLIMFLSWNIGRLVCLAVLGVCWYKFGLWFALCTGGLAWFSTNLPLLSALRLIIARWIMGIDAVVLPITIMFLFDFSMIGGAIYGIWYAWYLISLFPW